MSYIKKTYSIELDLLAIKYLHGYILKFFEKSYHLQVAFIFSQIFKRKNISKSIFH